MSGDLLKQIQQRLSDPGAGIDVAGIKGRATAGVNANYNQLQDAIEQQAVQRGYGRSGQLGTNLASLNVQRVNKLSDVQSQLEEYLNNVRLTERDRASRDALDFIRLGSGSKSSGVYDAAPSASGRAVSAGLEDLNFVLALSALLNGGGGSGLNLGI